MSYTGLAELIEKHRKELAQKAIRQALVFKVISEAQQEAALKGYEASYETIARYLRGNDTREWQAFVERVTKAQVARGVPNEGALAMADYITELINNLIERELPGEQNKALREKYLQRIQNLHSLGRVTVLVTQIKERGNR